MQDAEKANYYNLYLKKTSVWYPDHTVDKCPWCQPDAGESAREAPDPMSGSETLQKVWCGHLSCESNNEKSQHKMRVNTVIW